VFSLDDRTAIVTGAAVGVGRSLAAALARAGAVVTICDVRPDVERTAEQLSADGGQVTGVVAHVSRPDDVQRVVRQAAARTGGVDVLVNNAGVVTVTTPTDDWEKSLADFDTVIGTNLKGAFLFGRAVAPLMVERGGGEIVNVSTDHVHTCGWPDPVDHADAPTCPWRGERRTTGWVYLDLYDASKWALNGLTQSWAKMLRPHGIRVNNLCIGATDSAMNRGFFGYGYEPGTEPPAELLAWWMDPDRVADVMLDLLAEGPDGRSGDNVGLWLGHPTVLPPPSPVLDVRPDFDASALPNLGEPPKQESLT